jgi:hypothetical protein
VWGKKFTHTLNIEAMLAGVGVGVETCRKTKRPATAKTNASARQFCGSKSTKEKQISLLAHAVGKFKIDPKPPNPTDHSYETFFTVYPGKVIEKGSVCRRLLFHSCANSKVQILPAILEKSY